MARRKWPDASRTAVRFRASCPAASQKAIAASCSPAFVRWSATRSLRAASPVDAQRSGDPTVVRLPQSAGQQLVRGVPDQRVLEDEGVRVQLADLPGQSGFLESPQVLAKVASSRSLTALSRPKLNSRPMVAAS